MDDIALTPPLLTLPLLQKLAGARERGEPRLALSLDLGRSIAAVELGRDSWKWQHTRYPYPAELKERTVYAWTGSSFEPVSRFDAGLYKLVPTDWGPPTFEIDGIKMLPTARVSPFEDARAKVQLVAPRGKRVLDCCGGLGYFTYWCLNEQAAAVHSFEKSAAVLWLRGINPWSPPRDARLTLQHGNVAEEIARLPARGFDAILHDPPRFGIAGELYSQAFYDELARVIVPGGLMFHYTGAPNSQSRGRNLAKEVQRRLAKSGFEAEPSGDGVLARRIGRGTRPMKTRAAKARAKPRGPARPARGRR
jgi:predicted methyltransferase